MAASLRKPPPGGATSFLQRHLVIVLLAAALGYLPCPAEATCPDHLALRLRLCVMTSGYLDALKKTGSDVSVALEFCQSGVRAKVECLGSYENACGLTPDGNATLALMVDMDRIRENLQVFCSSLLTLQRDAACLRPNASDCVARVTEDFTTRDTSQLGGRGIIDLTCDFFDDVDLCLTFEEGDFCYEPASILRRLSRAFRFQYCDLSAEDKAEAAKYLPAEKIYVAPPETTTTTATAGAAAANSVGSCQSYIAADSCHGFAVMARLLTVCLVSLYSYL